MTTNTITRRPCVAQRGVTLHRYLLRGVVLGLIIGALVFALVSSTRGLIRHEASGETVVADRVVEFPRRELEREWRWKPKPVAVEHMYAPKRSLPLDWVSRPQSLDWIRNAGSRSRSGH